MDNTTVYVVEAGNINGDSDLMTQTVGVYRTLRGAQNAIAVRTENFDLVTSDPAHGDEEETTLDEAFTDFKGYLEVWSSGSGGDYWTVKAQDIKE